jgi:uncharacterized protein (DUF486 family)
MGFIPPSLMSFVPAMLLCLSNIFMTFARGSRMLIAIGGAWTVAFFFYDPQLAGGA